ncbi:unnamed protein product [Rangifer tarandus platyrhynchus]|uniref:Uncharacterized protein n=2 Tax=Rangifer tarandus platyrhynchus TaxID=3082113 RepID=A0AC59YFN7_RANTA|nr:unnamed protein product [Rangifer tarandus platyrhynchus]
MFKILQEEVYICTGVFLHLSVLSLKVRAGGNQSGRGRWGLRPVHTPGATSSGQAEAAPRGPGAEAPQEARRPEVRRLLRPCGWRVAVRRRPMRPAVTGKAAGADPPGPSRRPPASSVPTRVGTPHPVAHRWGCAVTCSHGTG